MRNPETIETELMEISTGLHWACWNGLRECGEGDYPAVARLLLAAGAKIPQ